jgi:hypothetical protein
MRISDAPSKAWRTHGQSSPAITLAPDLQIEGENRSRPPAVKQVREIGRLHVGRNRAIARADIPDPLRNFPDPKQRFPVLVARSETGAISTVSPASD